MSKLDAPEYDMELSLCLITNKTKNLVDSTYTKIKKTVSNQ